MRDEYFFEGDHQAPVKRFEQMLNGKSVYFFDVDEFEQIIDHYLIHMNYQYAVRALRIAMKQHPESLRLHLRRAQLALINNQPGEALHLIAQMEKHADYFPELHFLKGSAYLQLKQYDTAMLAFNEALANASADTLSEVAYKIGQAFLTFEQYDMALLYYTKGLEVNPTHPDMLYDAGICYHHRQDYDNSLLCFSKYLDEDPFDHTAWIYLAVAYNEKEQYEQAIEACDYALALNDEEGSAYFNKANAMAGLGHLEEAIALYKQCIVCQGTPEEDPSLAEVYCSIGECYEQLNDNQQARENYFHAVKLNENMSDAWYGLAMIAFRMNRMDESLKYLKKALFIQPSSPDYWFSLGNLFNHRNELKKAADAYRKAIELNPSDLESWLGLADLYFRKSMLSKAIKTLNESYPLTGDSPVVNFRLAAYHYLKGEPRVAMRFLKTALKLDNGDIQTDFFAFCPEAKFFPEVQKLLNQINQNPEKQ